MAIADISGAPQELTSSRTGAGTRQNPANQRIVDALRASILTGTLEPGERIRQEELAEQFHISRIPVREALKRLESEGLVTLRANSGAWVAKIDIDEFIDTYKIRERVEGLAIRESACNLTDTQIEEIDVLRLEIETADNVESFLELDRAFHLLTYSGARSATLLTMIERFWNTTQHYRRAFAKSLSSNTMWIIYAEHRLLVEALRRRDAGDSERTLYGHIRRTRIELTERHNAGST